MALGDMNYSKALRNLYSYSSKEYLEKIRQIKIEFMTCVKGILGLYEAVIVKVQFISWDNGMFIFGMWNVLLCYIEFEIGLSILFYLFIICILI